METSPEAVEVQPTEVIESVPVTEEIKAVVIPTPAEVIPKEREIAYVMNDRFFSNFEVKKSANAWWMDRRKVEDLIKAFKQGMSVELAIIDADISAGQYKYFLSLHPEFLTIKEVCQNSVKILIKKGIHNKLVEGKDEMIRWAAERLMPEEYGKPMGDAPNQTLNNFGTIITAPSGMPPHVLARIKKPDDTASAQ